VAVRVRRSPWLVRSFTLLYVKAPYGVPNNFRVASTVAGRIHVLHKVWMSSRHFVMSMAPESIGRHGSLFCDEFVLPALFPFK
jgi:hypothetical protein